MDYKNKEKEKINIKDEFLKEIIEDTRKKVAEGYSFKDEKEAFDTIEKLLLEDKKLKWLGYKEKIYLIESVYFSIRCTVGILKPYIEDKEVTEIMVNGKNDIFIEKSGEIVKIGKRFHSTEELENIIRRIAAGVHREINELNPIVDARLPDGSRVNAVYKNVALNGPILTIRRFPEKAFNMEDMVNFGTITEEAAEFMKKIVVGGGNIFISGGTGSGKTTFLNALSNFIPKDERVITIEDSAELQIKGLENLVKMECRTANVQGLGEVNMQQLIKSSLRMRPNRIIVGEVRGKEVLDMLNAFNTGHDGSLSTGHGNSISGMLKRLETMVMQGADYPIEAIRGQIIEGIDIMVHLGRLCNGKRRVLEISEICGFKDGEYLINKLFIYDQSKGLIKSDNKVKNTIKFSLRGVEL